MDLVWQEILTKFYKMASEKIKEILQKLNLGIQVEKFEQERIDPQVILALSDNCQVCDEGRIYAMQWGNVEFEAENQAELTRQHSRHSTN